MSERTTSEQKLAGVPTNEGGAVSVDSGTAASEERRDTKGRLIGRRSPANKNPRRNETGLCPGLESALATIIEQLDGLAASVQAMSSGGRVGSSGVVAEAGRIAQLARDLRGEWVDA